MRILFSLLLAVGSVAACLAADTCSSSSDQKSGGGIVRHFVAFKYKEGATAQQHDEIQKSFLELKRHISEVMSLENGQQNSPEKKDKGFTEAFLLTFANATDRDNYLVHPEHKKFLSLFLPHVADAFVFDFSPSGPAGQCASVGGTVIDLTHVLTPGIPDFHGDSHAFAAKQLFTVKKDGFANRSFCMPEHLGTHIDAPSHFVEGGQSIDQIQAGRLFLPCVVIDVRDKVKNNPDYCLTTEDVAAFEKSGKIPTGCAVLVLTGWGERWSNVESYRNVDSKGTMRYPAISPEAADFLVNQRRVSILGLDTISLDYGLSTTYQVHKLALAKNVLLIENLAQLEKVPPRGAMLFCGALPMEGGTGSPARVVALVP